MTPQSTCVDVSKNETLTALRSAPAREGGGGKKALLATKEILPKTVQVGPIISIVFDSKAPRGSGQIASSKYARPRVIK